jgi:hypothetical protein
LAGVAAAGLVGLLALWAWPTSTSGLTESIILLSVAVGFVAGPIALFAWITPDGRAQKQVRGLPWAWKAAAAVVCIVGLAVAVSGFMATDGFSATPEGEDPRCSWSISGDHGRDVRCVSHKRWLEVHDGGLRGLLGMLTVGTALGSATLIAVGRRGATTPLRD